MSVQKPLGIIFDLGDTILCEKNYNTSLGHKHLFKLLRQPLDVSIDDVLKKSEQVENEIKAQLEHREIEIHILKILKITYEQLGLEFNLTDEELELEFWKGTVKLSPEPGIYEIMDYLNKIDIAIGIISNAPFSSEILKWELKYHGLANHLKFVISSANYGIRKPNQLLFNLGIRKMNIGLDQIWYVGDRLGADIAGANQTGLTSVWYNKKGQENSNNVEPNFEIKSWSEFLQILNNA